MKVNARSLLRPRQTPASYLSMHTVPDTTASTGHVVARPLAERAAPAPSISFTADLWTRPLEKGTAPTPIDRLIAATIKMPFATGRMTCSFLCPRRCNSIRRCRFCAGREEERGRGVCPRPSLRAHGRQLVLVPVEKARGSRRRPTGPGRDPAAERHRGVDDADQEKRIGTVPRDAGEAPIEAGIALEAQIDRRRVEDRFHRPAQVADERPLDLGDGSRGAAE